MFVWYRVASRRDEAISGGFRAEKSPAEHPSPDDFFGEGGAEETQKWLSSLPDVPRMAYDWRMGVVRHVR